MENHVRNPIIYGTDIIGIVGILRISESEGLYELFKESAEESTKKDWSCPSFKRLLAISFEDVPPEPEGVISTGKAVETAK